MNKKYSLGIDFGTLSARGILFDITDGSELASSVFPYPHGVMDTSLPDGRKLPPGYALQAPDDYLQALDTIIPGVLQDAGVNNSDVLCIGVDFTACTPMPVAADGTPMCAIPKHASNPHAWVKLWKHHGAAVYAPQVTQAAMDSDETWLLEMYGGKISPETLLCKLLELYIEAPEVYSEAEYFMEAGDWITWMLTGQFSRSEAAAGICGAWRKDEGYPSDKFMECLAPGFSGALSKHLRGKHLPIGGSAGTLKKELAERWGLSADTVVATTLVDSQAAVPGAGIAEAGKMLATMGTSTVYLLMGDKKVYVPGMGACSADSIIPGFYGYSAGQSCVGDHFAWFVDNLFPHSYHEKARELGIGPHEYLQMLAQKQKPGQHGLIALDWWNGNRCVLADMDLSGTIVGMTLLTRAEDIYRALIEATAFGARKIVEAFSGGNVAIKEMYASGGIPQKSPLAMQIYADVLNIPIHICGSSNGPALGAAALAALAAGYYSSAESAVKAMGSLTDICYTPVPENVAIYDQIYHEFSVLHDYLGRGENTVMKALKTLSHDSQ